METIEIIQAVSYIETHQKAKGLCQDHALCAGKVNVDQQLVMLLVPMHSFLSSQWLPKLAAANPLR